MRIERLEVSGGFLDGLRLDFIRGLNVLIGPRGAGKTSVLELIRFALAVPAMTAEADEDAEAQARAVLGDGTVSLYCEVQGEQLVLSRTGLDDAPALSANYNYEPPLIVSQSEIEAIGLDPASRRGILDRLIDPVERDVLGTQEPRSDIASLQQRVERLSAERDAFLEQSAQLDGLQERLAEAEKEQASAAKEAEKARPLQESIAEQADQLGKMRSAADAYRLAEEALEEWRHELVASRFDRPIPKLPSADVRSEVKQRVSKAGKLLEEALEEIDAAKSLVASSRAEARSQQGHIQATLKENAEALEKLQTGAGEVGRRVSALRQQIQECEGLRQRAAELDAEIAAVIGDRDAALDDAETRAETRYQLRKSLASDVTKHFNGKIEVRVDKSGEFSAYEAALVDALQGSNLRYKSLAPDLAQKMSPRELVGAIETQDPGRVADAAQISSDRAFRLVAHLEQHSLTGLLLAPLDDSVDFALLDGQEYKPTRNLSMGQRCTVVLPLLLLEEREAILMDQPEDHLDNAFIVETLVEAIRERAKDGQVIVATHNANIPVLGDADQVVVLASDGRHGFISVTAPLEDDAAVDAITTLMEGGREAFARRAAFYSAHEHAK